MISIYIGATVVSSAFKYKWKNTIFTTKAKSSFKVEGWRRSGSCPYCLKTSKSIFTIRNESKGHCVSTADNAPSFLYMSTVSGTVVHLKIIMITFGIILDVEMEECKINSLALMHRSKSPNLNTEFNFALLTLISFSIDSLTI